ncbi:MAG: hypothetical protein WCG10_03915 [Chlamydiota bacterium]
MMSWEQLEKIFDRALKYSLCRKKNLFVIPILVLCGLLIVLCRALAITAGDWILLSLTFLPVFLSSGLLLAAGVVLIRVYSQDLKSVNVGFKNVLERSWQVLLNISYLSLPLLLAYLLLWTVMGVFYLLRELPALGDFISVILAFAPFLLILGAILLGLFNIVMLFFVTPVVALKTGVRLKLIEVVYLRLKQGVLSNCIFLFMGILPLGICLSILVLAARVTGASFFSQSGSLSMIFQWFFVMIPFSALLSPSVIFFFNFSTECFLLQKHKELAAEESR